MLRSVAIKICPKEESLLSEIRKLKFPKNVSLKCDSQLPTGDIIIQVDGDSKYKYYALIERKTVSDLFASLKDKRYEQQNSRMRKSLRINESYTCGYLLEKKVKDFDEKYENVKRSIIYKHRLSIWETKSTVESAVFLLQLAQKISSSYQSYIEAENIDDVVGGGVSGVLIKKGDLRMKHFFSHTLSLVPGVSTKIAQSITQEFPNFNSIFDAWKQKNSQMEKENLLSDIKTGARKLGPTISKRIFDLFNDV